MSSDSLRIILFSILFIGLARRLSAGKLEAITNGLYSEKLYLQIKNEDPPSESDPANSDASIRDRICDEITNSGFFDSYNMYSVKKWRIFLELRKRKYSAIFHQIYAPRKNRIKALLSPYKYSNLYKRRQFSSANTNEYVFVCLLRKWTTKAIVPLYVSKEYNVNAENLGVPFKPGRFILRDLGFNLNQTIFLAEEPAKVYEGSDYNVELLYLRMRSTHEPAEADHLDPVCKLLSEELEKNQHHRLCTVILTSSHFEEKFRYILRIRSNECTEEEVHFKTTEARDLAAEVSYFERMVNCPALTTDGKVKFFYISRAYLTNHVFVYEWDLRENKLYLENLSKNLAFVHEPTSFDDVE